MVGRIHGKTAIANNDQIVSGKSSGVQISTCLNVKKGGTK